MKRLILFLSVLFFASVGVSNWYSTGHPMYIDGVQYYAYFYIRTWDIEVPDSNSHYDYGWSSPSWWTENGILCGNCNPGGNSATIVGHRIVKATNLNEVVENSTVEPDDINPQCAEANTVDPINFISGNNHFSGPSISVSAPGISLSFDLSYESGETNRSAVGPGWKHSYDWALDVTPASLVIRAGDARKHVFITDFFYDYCPEHPLIFQTYWSVADNGWELTGPTNGLYTLRQPGGWTHTFDTNGVMQQISDAWGNRVDLVYSNGLLHSAEHSSGQSLTFAYSNGLLSAVTAATNLSLSLSYDSSGALTQSVRQAGSELFTETYKYNSSLLLTQKVDAAGCDFNYTYSTNNKATGMYLTDDRWYEHNLTYSTNGTFSQLVYSNGNCARAYEYDLYPVKQRIQEERFTTVTGKVTYAYDSHANVTRKITYDANTNRWTQIYRLYDGRNNITNEAFGLSAAPTNITHYTWHPEWQTLSSVTDPEGFKQEYEYTNGVIALSRIWLSTNKTAETFYSYTTNGLLAVITNANGHSTAFTYDALGYPETVVPQIGPVVTFGYNSLGHLTNSTLPGGRETAYTVTPLGWVERIDFADNLYETFQYDGLGDVTNHVDRAGRTTRYEYLPTGKLKGVHRQFGSTNVTVSYDYDQQFNTLSIRDELNRPVENYTLDPLDRPTIVTNLENQTMSIRYLVGDFVDSITRFDNTVVSNEYTGDGRLKAVHYPDETNRYTYLKNGLVQTLENSGSMVSNAWNSASWLTQTVFSASSVTSVVSYSYDPVGNVTNSSVNLQSALIDQQYTYDAAERLSSISSGLSTLDFQTFDYAYNTNNGLIAAVSNEHLKAEYEYDILDRITRIDWVKAGGTTVMSFDYQYNAAGMITNVVKDDGSQLSVKRYQYDDLDRLTGEAVFASSVPLRENSYSYDAAGNRQTKTGSGFTVGYSPGTGNRLASWSATSTNSFEDFRTLRVEGHSSEPIGTDNRWGQLYVSNSVAVTPEISGTNFSIEAFTVGIGTQNVIAAIRDQAGNVGYATNEIFLSVVTNGAYKYNTAGCVTNIAYTGTEYLKTLSLGWNAQYQLTSVTSATSAVEYSYDVLGRRTSRTQGTNSEIYVYDGNQIVADLDGSGNLLRSYVWGTGIDNLLCITTHSATETNTYYAIKDHLNSVHALVNETGTIVERYEYDAWGRITVFDASGNELAQSGLGNRYCFQGREFDWEMGLYYFRARWYGPVSARWLSNDPIGISGGLNQYVFCSNNPVNCWDPLGLNTYRQNRVLSALASSRLGTSSATRAPVTHTFIYTTKTDGSLNNTYSWGNATDSNGNGLWFKNRPEDRTAANEAINNPSIRGPMVGDASLDPYIDVAFNALQNDPNSPSRHPNHIVTDNCKTESTRLVNDARRLQGP